jgi:tRNA N6-adenosine threonylcarbamoyltransferase
LAILLRSNIPFPYLTLVVSGGHTMIVLVKSPLQYVIMDTTLDDSVGEVMDKMANILGLRDAKELSDLATRGTPNQEFRVWRSGSPPIMSFSGLKTRYMILAKESKHSAETISCMLMNDIAHILVHSCRHAFETLKASSIDVSNIVITGGVAKCRFLRGSIMMELY